LVARRKYASISDALRGLALSAVRDKTTYYRRRIRKFERKYVMDFDKFTARLKGRATPPEEDDWLAWRSAQRMLTDWERAYRDLRNARAH
jgi:hypothetical protein